MEIQMISAPTMAALLDSIKDPILFVDNGHTIRYMNKAAEKHYKEGRRLLGQSIMDCHNKESCKMMYEIYAKMQAGLDEEKITDDEKQRIFMRAVRDENGILLGYYERYEWKNQDK